MRGGYEDDDAEFEPWIAFNANNGGCALLIVLSFLAAYGLYRLVTDLL